MRSQPWPVPGGLLLAACATPPPQLEPYPGVGKRIIAYHDGQSATDDPTCTTTRMRTIGAMKVPSDTPRQLVVSVRYFYDTENHDELHGGCQGQGTRAFTLDEAGGALTVAGVSAPHGGLWGRDVRATRHGWRKRRDRSRELGRPAASVRG